MSPDLERAFPVPCSPARSPGNLGLGWYPRVPDLSIYDSDRLRSGLEGTLDTGRSPGENGLPGPALCGGQPKPSRPSGPPPRRCALEGGTLPRCPAVFFLDRGGACVGVGEAAGHGHYPLTASQGLWSAPSRTFSSRTDQSGFTVKPECIGEGEW